MLTYVLLFFSCVPFFDFDLDIVCFVLSFSCGYYAVSSVLVSAATRLAYYMYLDILIPTYADLTFFFFNFGLRFTICASYCVYHLSAFIRFPPEAIFHSRAIGACPLTTD